MFKLLIILLFQRFDGMIGILRTYTFICSFCGLNACAFLYYLLLFSNGHSNGYSKTKKAAPDFSGTANLLMEPLIGFEPTTLSLRKMFFDKNKLKRRQLLIFKPIFSLIKFVDNINKIEINNNCCNKCCRN